MSGDSLTDLKSEQPTAGYFGKIPVRGDFLSHGLPREFVDSWDDWIQYAMDNSIEQLSDSWLDVYLTSPVWHYALSPTVCGDSGWAGVFMPSVDSVGRYFPLTIAAPIAQGCNTTTILSSHQEWLGKVEELARSSLEDGFDLDEFDSAVQALECPLGEPGNGGQTEMTSASAALLNAWRYALTSPVQIEGNCSALLQELMGRLFFAYSFWWTAGSARVSPTFLICQGLPPPEGFAAMLNGEWQQWGWEDKHVLQPRTLVAQDSSGVT